VRRETAKSRGYQKRDGEVRNMVKYNVCPITTLKTLLFATDGSEYSMAAMSQAFNLASACSTKIYALSVVEANPEYASLAPQLVEKASARAREILEGVKAAATKKGLNCETVVHTGEDPAQFVIEEATKVGADMIIMGKHGVKKGLKKFFMGSVTAKVINEAPCSVLVVKT
jgi:nucleotide-binding universal stress UspA family protein